LDFSGMATSSSNRGLTLSGSYWHVKGLDIKGAGDNGMYVSGSYDTVEYCAFYRNRDSGMQLSGGASYNTIINCDSYYNKDTAQGNADGFSVKMDVGTGNYFYGCRSWQNSDDGWDGYLRGADSVFTTLENCWCFMNGYLLDGSASSGNGNGYKLGGSDDKSLKHNFTLKKCLSFDNRVKGFDENNNKGSMTLYNCTGYRNGTNYSFTTAIDTGSVLTLINCVALGSYGSISIPSTQQTNSWMSPFTVTTSDFQSIDTTGMRGARNSDGSLPSSTFMHLATGSDLIDAGTNVGLAYNGSAPDLGFYESGSAALLATVATTSISSITQTSASSGGTISSDGGATVTARGVCWNSTGTPTLSNSYTTDGSGTGTYTSSLTGLAVGTMYYVRAYATNSAGTSYGSQVSFTTSGPVVPSVATSSVGSITQTTVSCGGVISSDGGASVTVRGVCWNTSGTPTISDSHTSDGTGVGTFTSSLSGLTAGTTYYIRAYATNSAGTGYGTALSFTTSSPVLPTLTTTSISAIGQTGASGGGTISADGGASVIARGVCWNTTGTPTISDSHTTDGTGTGSFTSSLSGLSLNTLYFVRAYATNSAGTAYGAAVSFTTLNATVATVSTDSITFVTQTTAIGHSTISSNGGASITARGICWNTTGSPSISDSHSSDSSGTGTFTSSLSSLIPGTVYYAAAYATNSIGTAYGSVKSFTTLSLSLPAVTTSSPTSITTSSAACGGTVTADGGATVTARGVCWNTSGTPTISDSHTSNGTGTGSFSSSLTSLTSGTTYHVRAYATNSVGTAYGADSSFQTISTAQADSVKWILTANQNATSGTHVNGTTQVFSSGGGVLSMSVKDYSAGTTNGGERCNLGSTSWPTETKQNDGRYLEFSLAPAAGYDFTTSSISFDIGYAGTTAHMFSNLYYSTDGWTSRTKINTDSIVSASSTWNSPSSSFAVNISVPNGTTLALRLYPWYTSSPSTTKYLAMRNFTVKGTTGGSTKLATVSLSDISNVAQSSVTVHGTVSDSGSSAVSARGVCWSTSAGPTISNGHTSDGTGAGAFTSSIMGLSAGTVYHVRVYATNGVGTNYGTDTTFTTLTTSPVVSTSSISNITYNSATCGGIVTDSGGVAVSAKGVCWSTSANPTISGSHTTDGVGVGSFTSSITGLSAGTLYHVRAYATNSAGTSYGADSTCTTLAALPTVSTASISNITATTATSGGNVTNNGGAAIIARGVCWSTSANPVISGSHTSDSSGMGSFTSLMTGLTPATTYHVRAYATNSAGTGYGADSTFTISAAFLSGNVTLKVIPEGFYNAADYLNSSDTIFVYLANAGTPYSFVDSTAAILASLSFSATANFSIAATGNYYLVVKHRNCIETWSASPVSFAKGSTMAYDFTDAQTEAFGGNLVQVSSSPVRWAIYSGDVNQDGYVDPLDLSIVDQASFNYEVGRALAADVTGDGYVDPLDLAIVDKNSFNYVGVQSPHQSKSARARTKLNKP
jgi:hypothetical protein